MYGWLCTLRTIIVREIFLFPLVRRSMIIEGKIQTILCTFVAEYFIFNLQLYQNGHRNTHQKAAYVL